MSYRPQFVYKTPDGFTDEPYEHYFDGVNTAGLTVTLSPGQSVNNIPLQIESDAEFHWRGIQVGDINSQAPVLVWFRDSQNNDLSDDFVPMQFYSGNLGPGAFQGGETQALEPEIVMPAGSVARVSLLLYP